MTFIGLFTALMVISQPPFGDLPCYNSTIIDNSTITDNSTSIDNSTSMEFESTQSSRSAIRIATIVFAALGLFMEAVQLYLIRLKGYLEFHNLLDWVTYIGSIVLATNISTCGQLKNWQWQLAVACLFLSYMNMIFFLRIIPSLGIYIMMVALMLKNFCNFFLIMLLFLLAFGICFHLLAQNQVAFSTIPYSVMKSCDMMLGEVDFAGICLQHIDNDEPSVQLQDIALRILYIAFLVFMSLVIMNLLTSLSVSGVETLQKDSQHKILALQINKALDVEFCYANILTQKAQLLCEVSEVRSIACQTFSSIAYDLQT